MPTTVTDRSHARFDVVWASFRDGLIGAHARLRRECAAAAASLERGVDAIDAAAADAGQPPAPDELDAFRRLFAESVERLLLQPIKSHLEPQPIARAVAAIERHHTALDDLVRGLPVVVTTTADELHSALGSDGASAARTLGRRGPVDIRLRENVERELDQHQPGRLERFDDVVIALATMSTLITDPWELTATETLSLIDNDPSDTSRSRRALSQWRVSVARAKRQLAAALARLEADLAPAPDALARRLGRRPSKARRRPRQDRRQRLRAEWADWGRAVTDQIELHRRVVDVARRAWDDLAGPVDAVADESRDLRLEREQIQAWLAAWPHPAGAAPPRPVAQLDTAENRSRAWAEQLARVLGGMPVTVGVLEPRRLVRLRRREIRPRDLWTSALQESGRPAALASLREAEATHRAIVRDVERVREVIAYVLEVDQAKERAADQVLREGLSNAASLLAESQQRERDPTELVRQGVTRSLSHVFLLGYIGLEHGRFGVLAHLARYGWGRSLTSARQRATRALRALPQRIWRQMAALQRWILVRIRWERGFDTGVRPVERRGGLALRADPGPRVVPMIYERLFQPQPVEDPRFLVGRGVEMAAFEEVRARWQAGQAASVVVVGQRGSGKTSLLNCALAKVFADDRIIRSRLEARTRTAADMRAFLRDLLDLGEGDELREAIRRAPCVVVIEELERSFLRGVDGYGAIRELLSTVADTSREVLWILAMNRASFQLLDGVVGIGAYFSHRVNAMSVEPQHIREAILLRHHLSGFQLHFVAPRDSATRWARLQRLVHIGEDPAETFFDALYRQSEGVYRSAFYMWRRHIEHVDAATLYMGPPAAPDIGALTSEVSRMDRFTLQAILQHGSLEPREHAEVFGVAEDFSRDILEQLASRGLLEQDPTVASWRVRPEAHHVVHRLLHAENLL